MTYTCINYTAVKVFDFTVDDIHIMLDWDVGLPSTMHLKKYTYKKERFLFLLENVAYCVNLDSEGDFTL